MSFIALLIAVVDLQLEDPLHLLTVNSIYRVILIYLVWFEIKISTSTLKKICS